MTPRDIKHRASEARRLLYDPLFVEAIEALEKQAIDEIVRLPFFADRKRRMLADRVRVIRSFREHLTAAIVGGEDATRKRPTLP